MMLSILCITQLELYAEPFLDEMVEVAASLSAELVLAVDGLRDPSRYPTAKIIHVTSRGFMESVLDAGIAACSGDYVLRLDDDERCSPAMIEWLREEKYLTCDLWSFPRTHMWPNAQSVVMTPPLFPDNQTRLSIKAKGGGRGDRPHMMSPFGMGDVAPVTIEHHKFLVRSREERQETARKWHSAILCGIDMRVFSLPEDVHPTLDVVEAGDGSIPWNPSWQKQVSTRV